MKKSHYPGHRRELLKFSSCINCGKDISGIISRKNSYSFMKEHWDCKRQFDFPNKIGGVIIDDWTPLGIPSWKEYNNYWDISYKGTWPFKQNTLKELLLLVKKYYPNYEVDRTP